MKNKATVFAIISLVSGTALANTSVLESAGKQLVKDAAITAAPEAVKGAEAAGEVVKDAQGLKESVKTAPAAAQEQARESLKKAAEEKLKQATPEEIKQGKEALKTGQETVKQLKGKADLAPKSTKEAKAQAKQKVAEKALDLLQ
ncbi:MAG: hypothetical protein ACXV7F_02315 [Methylomonas sp.]